MVWFDRGNSTTRLEALDTKIRGLRNQGDHPELAALDKHRHHCSEKLRNIGLILESTPYSTLSDNQVSKMREELDTISHDMAKMEYMLQTTSFSSSNRSDYNPNPSENRRK